MADRALTTWSAKQFYGAVLNELTWRPMTSIPRADTDSYPDTAPDPDWLPLINTPSPSNKREMSSRPKEVPVMLMDIHRSQCIRSELAIHRHVPGYRQRQHDLLERRYELEEGGRVTNVPSFNTLCRVDRDMN